MGRTSLFTLMLLFAASGAAPTGQAPGSMSLLPGYKVQELQGTDTQVGVISKDGGLAIRYDIGVPAGYQAMALKANEVLWRKEQKLGGRRVVSALTKDRTLYVTFFDDSANFNGKVNTDEDLADFLLMVLTYAPQKPEK